jgi:TadE-like protein
MSGNMSPSRGSGIERGLTFGPGTADKGGMGSSWARESAQAGAGRSSDRERGQALVEFALILPLFVVLLVGLVQFGVGLNYWLDLNRLANQGVRWAVVNCNPASAGVCEAADGTQNIELAIKDQRTSGGNTITKSKVCYETTKSVGQPLTVSLEAPFGFRQILDLEWMTLRAKASMRIEQNLTNPALANGIVDKCSSP